MTDQQERTPGQIDTEKVAGVPIWNWNCPCCQNRLRARIAELEAERDRGLDLAKALCGERDVDAAFESLEAMTARIEHLEAALREAMELHRIAVVYVLAATPRTERTDYIDRLGALEALALTTSTQEDA